MLSGIAYVRRVEQLAPGSGAQSSVLRGAAVLLVGEDVGRVHALARVLRDEGVTLVTASSAPESLVRLTAQRPDVVIVDGALGSPLARLLAGVSPHVPMIFVTAACTATELRGLLVQLLIEPRMRAR